ncbi:small Rho-like GTP-binding protein [Hamiltosporidium tvaerminnensis]|uniref:Small Rho-like GTP-binding protein n=2 Tax=Hamiltosporidium TaxID=1176354 RepID=A0A4Q9LBT2_9MICR|nr:hypothetical protein LUQ84_3425 [Hamiltosporidium tvaerminnensis]TBU04320.1 small Rho-like GTP-binding protein [Hamiltosporidium tvaerminnensis]TBU07957.1 small Rho-like GTP-binding protein [Hamiltosporidium magnivora]TBU10923.1 small Rho-like GTP-binding protein [Hamiltosporidium tvaerminnensis]TBU11290.1 small Rho-like GTP-binding protein [Hamiltosporidium tvaerminnensis]
MEAKPQDDKSTNKSGKVVVVGDGACGKTCLLEVFKRNRFPEEYIPTVVDNFVKDVVLDDEENTTVTLTLWDTAGQEDYDSVRPLSYKDTDLVLLCYSIENRSMLPNISNKWLYEIKNYCPTASYFLIGLKKDIRTTPTPDINPDKIITYEEGQNISNEINSANFLECSAKTGENVDAVFKAAAEHIRINKSTAKKEKKWYFCFCC